MTSCVRENSSIVVTPPLYEYSPEVQARAADELESLGPPCPRQEVTPDCSALRTLVNDYGTVRGKIRAVQQ